MSVIQLACADVKKCEMSRTPTRLFTDALYNRLQTVDREGERTPNNHYATLRFDQIGGCTGLSRI